METRPPSPWFTAITCSVCVVVAAAVVLSMLRQDMIAQLEEGMNTRHDAAQETLDKLTKRIAALEEKTTALSALPQAVAVPDTAATDALNAQMMASNAEIAALTARVEMVEKKPEPAPAVAPPVMAASPAAPVVETPPAPAAVAVVPTPVSTTDETLRRDLQMLLAHATTPAEPVKDSSLAGRINSRFAGFISVKKRTEMDVYAPLRRDAATADIPTLMRHVLALPPAARAPFADWLIAVQTRPVPDTMANTPPPLTTE